MVFEVILAVEPSHTVTPPGGGNLLAGATAAQGMSIGQLKARYAK
jgi:hypothetical protein